MEKSTEAGRGIRLIAEEGSGYEKKVNEEIERNRGMAEAVRLAEGPS